MRIEKVSAQPFLILPFSFLTYLFLQEPCGVTHTLCHDFFRSAAGNDGATFLSALRTEVYHVVGTLNHVKIVLNNQYGMPTRNEGIEGTQQALDVVKVESCSGFVKDEHDRAVALLAQIIGELDTLVLSSR